MRNSVLKQFTFVNSSSSLLCVYILLQIETKPVRMHFMVHLFSDLCKIGSELQEVPLSKTPANPSLFGFCYVEGFVISDFSSSRASRCLDQKPASLCVDDVLQ